MDTTHNSTFTHCLKFIEQFNLYGMYRNLPLFIGFVRSTQPSHMPPMQSWKLSRRQPGNRGNSNGPLPFIRPILHVVMVSRSMDRILFSSSRVISEWTQPTKKHKQNVIYNLSVNTDALRQPVKLCGSRRSYAMVTSLACIVMFVKFE